MTPTERRQVAALLRRAARIVARMAYTRHRISVWDAIERLAPSTCVRYHALREWHRALPRRRGFGIELRVLLALMLSAAIEAGDLP